MIRLSLLLLLWWVSAWAADPRLPPLSALHEGDLIFHTSRSAQSVAIQQATGSPYSHMGLLLRHEGQLVVLEASATVRYTPLEAWIARGEGGQYAVRRLREADRLLTPEALIRLHQEADALTGRPYDLTFAWSDERIYCSELVWKVYQRATGLELGALQPIRTFNLEAPAVQQKLRERYGTQVPLEEPVISPAAMLDAALLVPVEGP